jgi:hypothetical protein
VRFTVTVAVFASDWFVAPTVNAVTGDDCSDWHSVAADPMLDFNGSVNNANAVGQSFAFAAVK